MFHIVNLFPSTKPIKSTLLQTTISYQQRKSYYIVFVQTLALSGSGLLRFLHSFNSNLSTKFTKLDTMSMSKHHRNLTVVSAFT